MDANSSKARIEYFESCMAAVKRNGMNLRFVSKDMREGPILGYLLCKEALNNLGTRAHKIKKYIPSEFKDLL